MRLGSALALYNFPSGDSFSLPWGSWVVVDSPWFIWMCVYAYTNISLLCPYLRNLFMLT